MDCEVGDWSEWSDCSATCGGGTKTRGRGVVQEAENGGAVCPALEEEGSCNTDQCPGNLLTLWQYPAAACLLTVRVQLTVKLKIGLRGLTAV